MTEDIKTQLGNIWNGFRKKTEEVVHHSSSNLTLGKITAKDILDDEGVVLAKAGEVIDEETFERVRKAGKTSQLIANVVTAQVQDQQERMKIAYESTPEGTDAHNLATSELYLEARQYIRYVAAIEVTDIRGNILIPAGKKIEDEDVRLARDADQLAALIYSAQQSGKPELHCDEDSEVQPPTTSSPPLKRTAFPLGESFEESSGSVREPALKR